MNELTFSTETFNRTIVELKFFLPYNLFQFFLLLIVP